MRFDICIYPCNHHASQVIEYFITPENALILSAGSLPPSPWPQATTEQLSVTVD